MSGERFVMQPLVARKEGGGHLALILIDRGRKVKVLGAHETGRVLLSYNGNRLVADERDIGARTVAVTEPAGGRCG